MIIISNIALAINILATYQFISGKCFNIPLYKYYIKIQIFEDPTNFHLLLLFGVLLGAIILVILMILFWISPSCS